MSSEDALWSRTYGLEGQILKQWVSCCCSGSLFAVLPLGGGIRLCVPSHDAAGLAGVQQRAVVVRHGLADTRREPVTRTAVAEVACVVVIALRSGHISQKVVLFVATSAFRVDSTQSKLAVGKLTNPRNVGR